MVLSTTVRGAFRSEGSLTVSVFLWGRALVTASRVKTSETMRPYTCDGMVVRAMAPIETLVQHKHTLPVPREKR